MSIFLFCSESTSFPVRPTIVDFALSWNEDKQECFQILWSHVWHLLWKAPFHILKLQVVIGDFFKLLATALEDSKYLYIRAMNRSPQHELEISLSFCWQPWIHRWYKQCMCHAKEWSVPPACSESPKPKKQLDYNRGSLLGVRARTNWITSSLLQLRGCRGYLGRKSSCVSAQLVVHFPWSGKKKKAEEIQKIKSS